MMAPQVVTKSIDSLLSARDHDVIYGRSHETDPDIVALAEAIKLSGHYQFPGVTDTTPNTPPGTIVTGYRVVLALRSLGYAEVQVVLLAFKSETHLRQAIVLLNQHRIKSKWTMVMEVKVMTESLRPASKARQQKAGGPRRKPSAASGLASVPPVDSDSEAVDEIDLIEQVDLANALSPLSAAVAESGAISEDASAMAPIDHMTDATQADAVNETEESPPRDPSRTRTRSNRGGETLKHVARALQLGTDTTRLCLLFYAEAARQNSDDPGASEVAIKLQKPGAKFEAVAREYDLAPAKTVPSEGNPSTHDPLSDVEAVALAMKRLAIGLMPPSTTPDPTPLAPKLGKAMRGAVDASIALLTATSDPSLRLVHECPRDGVDLPKLHDDQMTINVERLRDTIRDALAGDWTEERIADDAKLSGEFARHSFVPWCQDRRVSAHHADLCKLTRWAETNLGRSPS